MFAQQYGPWAVIAGGSEGVGACFANKLAARGLNLNLVLLARKPQPLEQTAQKARNHGVQVRTASIDLTAPDMLEKVKALTDDLEVGMLIYNAGVHSPAAFLDRSLEKNMRLVRLTINGPIALAHHFGGAMRERKRGGIILLGSMSGFAGGDNYSLYAGSKAFNMMFAESLWFELRPYGVNVLSFIIGLTRTPTFLRGEGLELEKRGAVVMECDDAAQEGLDHLEDGPTWIAGAHNREWAKALGTMERKAAVEMMSGASN